MIKEDKYAENLLKSVKELQKGLAYYIKRTHELESENKILSDAYENRVKESLKE